MLSSRVNTSTGTLSGSKSQRRFREEMSTLPEPDEMRSVIASGWSALSKISSQRR